MTLRIDVRKLFAFVRQLSPDPHLEMVVEHMRSSNQLVKSNTKRQHRLCDTLWVEYHHLLLALVELLSSVVQCLEDMQQGWKWCNVQKCCQLTKQLDKFNYPSIAGGVHLFCYHWQVKL